MKVSDLDKVVIQELDDFFNASVEDLQQAAETAAKWAAKELKNTSPKRRGLYAKEWKVKKEPTRTGAKTIIYNDKLYMLSHLLEYGHPLPQGGRTKAQTFIKPVEQRAGEKFEEEVKRRIENDA